MGKIVQIKHTLDYYLHLFDTKMSENDYLGALDAGRNAILYSRTRIDKQAMNLLLSQVYYEMGLYVLSCEYAFRAVRNIETRANAYFCIGRNLVKQGRYKLAVKYFGEVLNSGGYAELAGAVLDWCNYVKEKLISNKTHTDNVDIVRMLVKQKRYQEALDVLESNLSNNDITYQVLYCDVLVLLGECNRARDILHKILRFDRENIGAIIVLVNICLYDSDYISLEQNLEKLDNLSLNNTELEAIANIYAKIGNYSKAVEIYKKILKNDEFNVKILLFIAICYYNLQNIKEALYYIGQARWIDLENPVLSIFYEIINTKKEENLQVSTSIPLKTGQEKLNFIFETLDLQNFEGVFETSLTLASDIEWCLTIKNADFCSKIIQKLAKSHKKSIISFYLKLLLTLRVGSKQKFFLAKYALSYGRLKVIDFTNNMQYHSFRLKIPNFLTINSTLLNGFCGAVVYSEIFNINLNLDKITQKLRNKNLESIDFPFTENLVSCLYFCENNKLLENACIYFDTPKTQVDEAIKCLNLL